jgi:hypothetical protein
VARERMSPVREIAVPAEARSLSTLPRIDYADAFLVDCGADERTPEQWAAAMLDGAPLGTRTKLVWGWVTLGFRMGAPWPGRHLLGWKVRRSTPEYVLLGADSLIGMPGELLFKRHDGGMLFSTFVQKQNPLARAVWARIEPAHRPIVRSMLERAAARR